ncbi:metal ABC transporter ATP-binding protein [Candidatus Saccharibacteria bacterium]|nr:metal ABC transporter ATP-binding protein [Candidatus Saccharibacteria bacterium]
MDLLSVKNLNIVYDKNTIISSANFSIKKGDFVCVVGSNGSGKSTLIKTLLGLIFPASGKIIFDKTIKKHSIGYLPQESKIDQSFPATVLEIVLSGTLEKSSKKFFYKKSDKNCAEDCLKNLNIEKLKTKCFSELSGGQKQKVLLARALASTSDLLFLDEPSNNLDYKSRKEFYSLLKSLNENGLTIIMITHDIDSDDLIGNKIISIKDGKVKSSTTKEFLRSYQ